MSGMHCILRRPVSSAERKLLQRLHAAAFDSPAGISGGEADPTLEEVTDPIVRSF